MPITLTVELSEQILEPLRKRAEAHGWSVESEARELLRLALQAPAGTSWDQVNALKRRLAASGRKFQDSAELLREDRER